MRDQFICETLVPTLRFVLLIGQAVSHSLTPHYSRSKMCAPPAIASVGTGITEVYLAMCSL